MSDINKFEFLGNCFEITEEFKTYNSVRSEHERKAFEIEERYSKINDKMLEEFACLAQPVADKYISTVKSNVKTLAQAQTEGMDELNRYQVNELSEIGRHLIFKYTNNDAITANDVSQVLFSDPTERYLETYDAFFVNISNDIEQLDTMREGLQAKRNYQRSTRDEPTFGGFGFGFRGTVIAAAGAATANAGMGLLRGFGDAIGAASDTSKVEKEVIKGLDRAKKSLILMADESFNRLREHCQEKLLDDLKAELDALGREPYKQLNKTQRRELALKDENYDEAYAEGDITGERYAAHVFNAMNDDPYNENYYSSLYQIASEHSDKVAKDRVMEFARYLGLDKPLIRDLELKSVLKLVEMKKMSEASLSEIDRKCSMIVRLYGKEAEAEAKRLMQKAESLKRVPEIQKDVAKYQRLISAGDYRTVFIRPDQTVGAIGDSSYGRCKTKHLRNVVAVSSCGTTTIALIQDGTVAAGGTGSERPNTENWRDIISISAGSKHCVGLKRDGTLVSAVLSPFSKYNYGQTNISGWSNIIAVSAGSFCTIGLRPDGTVVAVGALKDTYEGDPKNDLSKLSSWSGIAAVSAGYRHVLGLKTDGSVMAEGTPGADDRGQDKVADWSGIVMVAAGCDHSVGLRMDGTVVAVGRNEYGQCNVSDWRDIVTISSAFRHTVGLKSDGTLVATGENCDGCCNLSGVRLRLA